MDQRARLETRLTFDAALHEYRRDGELVPHVTQIIAPLTRYDLIPADKLEVARQQGQAIHKMVELDCRNDLDVERLPAWMRGCHNAWSRFKAETGFECWASEQLVHHERLGYAGTLDLAGLMPKLKTSKKPACVDVKRSFYAGPAIGLQTVAYADGWNSAHLAAERLHERYALALYPAGTYRLEIFEGHDDSVAFLACLQQFRWKEKRYGRR